MQHTYAKALLQKHSRKVRFSVQHYPLSFHKLALFAAIGAEKSRSKGMFWEVHDALIRLKNPSRDSISQIFKLHDIGTVSEKDAELLKIVESDQQFVKKLRVAGTPTFFLCCPDGSVWHLGHVGQMEALLK
jgi:protein-disulfide isomerase